MSRSTAFRGYRSSSLSLVAQGPNANGLKRLYFLRNPAGRAGDRCTAAGLGSHMPRRRSNRVRRKENADELREPMLELTVAPDRAIAVPRVRPLRCSST